MATGQKIVDNSLLCLAVSHPKPHLLAGCITARFAGFKAALFAGVKVAGCGEKWPTNSVKYILE